MSWIPNLITTTNLVLGLSILAWTLPGRWEIGCWLILVCTLLDSLDGRVARWLGQESVFGRRLDTFADGISFGLVPALLFHALMKPLTPAWAWGATLLYCLCAIFRLIRFQIHREKAGSEIRPYFQGLPTTAAAGFAASFLLLVPPGPELAWFHLSLFGGLAALMVSPLPYFNPSALKIRKPLLLVGLLGWALWVLLGTHPAWISLLGFSSYILSGILIPERKPLKPLQPINS